MKALVYLAWWSVALPLTGVMLVADAVSDRYEERLRRRRMRRRMARR